MHTKKLISVLILCILIPVIVIGCFFLTKGKQYYLVSLLLIAVSLFPFFLSLERKKLQMRELVIMASIIAVSVISRGAFFYLPNIKPMCAILIMTSVSFGTEFGFVCGALSMLLSNFIFGQGMWTPFQMLGMGLTVFLCSLVCRTFHWKNRFIIGICSGILCFAVYGVIVDLSSVFMMLSSFNWKSVLSVYASGIPFNIIHGITTAVIITVFQPITNDKLERIKIKYGLFGTSL